MEKCFTVKYLKKLLSVGLFVVCRENSEPATETVEDDDDNVFWSVSQMMLKAVLSQHSAAPSDDDNKHQLSTSVSMRVPGLYTNTCNSNKSSVPIYVTERWARS